MITARQRRRQLTLGASRCLLLFFSRLPPRRLSDLHLHSTTYRNRRRRFEGCCHRGGGRWDGGAKCTTGLLGEECLPIDPAHTANGKRSAAETSRASRFSSVRKAASSLSFFTVFSIKQFFSPKFYFTHTK